ncbi:restriction endonuclease subunit S [Aquitalea pelogenes]|uniref:restriction endonuclease subunit S n=1 Tax=Aquitalea pelogenes TaxID=1293573 RepID=UPI000788FE74|nr:restriction endonuclease subunit S [Aquitalea pelogenes]
MSSKNKTTATTDEAKHTLVPKLRFPEFRGGEGWEYAPLGKLLMKSPDYGVNAAAVPFTERLPQYLRITDISEDGTYLSAKKVSVDLEPKDEIYLEEGDIVLARTGASVGKSYRYRKADGRLVFAGFLIRVKPNPKRLVSTYLANFLTTEQYWKWVAATSARSGQPGINSVEYSALPIPLPTEFPEQQKIADCLSSVDELIAVQAQKVDALKTHKKGLMQQLFPREGETQPRLRFPEFQNAGKWEEQHLGDYFDPIRNGFVGTATPYYTTSDGIRYLQGRNIKQGRIEADNLIFITSEFHNRQRKSHLKTGDILMVQSGHVGECAVIGPDFVGANCHALVILTPKRKLSSDFFAHYFYSPIGKLAIFQITTGNTIKHILASELKTLPVLVPDLSEQQRIASCLSSLDTLITAEDQKLEALKTHKKGLMQQLFPSTDEVRA